MSSASAAIVAPLPAPPTTIVAAPSPPTISRPVPMTPLVAIDGTKVLVIPPFIRASFAGAGTGAATYTSSSTFPAQAGATGVLAADVTVRQPMSVGFGATGTLGYALAFGPGTTRVLPAQFGANATSTATDAAFGCRAALAVTVNSASSPLLATFGGAGLLTTQLGPPPTVNAAGSTMGSLSATTGVLANFSGTGAAAATLFAPSGMNKNGSQSGPSNGNWTQVTGWTADTANFPGSSVSTDALAGQGTKAGATVATSISWAPSTGFINNTLGIRIKQNGTPIATAAPTTTSPAHVSAVVTVSPGDKFTVEVQDDSGYPPNWKSTINGGASSYLQIT
ncbi:hypothetical protein OHB26_16455 [Nocardia sp. NBC_01503]|uniref:hypothetical protein n=1 Tax=Nocardia sp. NBC_01503 TaxID=2975997 RepID=UPI002E7B577F|nr:hypothetical protein [Nocardia sp. NBC_01503]WTL35643.1 hypothetical protein OHB26_16455 [Nocardia sp. NBC_01503]